MLPDVASSWCDPVLWIPEAARLLRPGGRLVFLRDSGFAVDELTEFVVSADARSDYGYVTPEWVSTWPSVEVWKATRV
ncbi:hypothetical protein [Kribbella soli]|uniref:hypothetical protein n=1 Tax=Kribbella soli TaxID=1124743 RepID=UPI00192DA0E1|nr:hypothetical protein [Kribbella soli]